MASQGPGNVASSLRMKRRGVLQCSVSERSSVDALMTSRRSESTSRRILNM